MGYKGSWVIGDPIILAVDVMASLVLKLGEDGGR